MRTIFGLIRPFVPLLALVSLPASMNADILVVSSLAGYIEQVDTSTNTITQLLNTNGVAVDSLIFAPGDDIVFSEPNVHRIGIFNTVTQDVQYVYGFVEPHDLALDPSGTSVLVSDDGDQYIKRLDLTSQYPVPVILGGWMNDIDGITYDNAGRLFVVQSWNGRVMQIDPNDGHVIKSLQCTTCRTGGSGPELDGITFDPVTGDLWVSGIWWNGIWEFDTTLTTSTLHAQNRTPFPDGIEADGAGNIFVASRGQDRIYEYNIASGTTTALTAVNRIDDLAPLTGLGSQGGPNPSTAVPEPGSLASLATVFVFLSGLARRQFVR
jgi:DNA-binding beta-propeller fold protein YncE